MLWGALWVVAWVLAILLALAIAVLATPWKLGVRLGTEPRWRLRVGLGLFGGLAPPIPLHDSARRRKAEPKPPKRQTGRRRPPGRARRAKKVMRRAASAPGLLLGLLRPIHLERLAVEADIGLDDPADTGQLYGLLSAVNRARPPGSRISVAVRPDFTGPRASGELDAMLSFVPLAFVPPAVRLGWHLFGRRR
jgi:hypothetical protein